MGKVIRICVVITDRYNKVKLNAPAEICGRIYHSLHMCVAI